MNLKKKRKFLPLLLTSSELLPVHCFAAIALAIGLGYLQCNKLSANNPLAVTRGSMIEYINASDFVIEKMVGYFAVGLVDYAGIALLVFLLYIFLWIFDKVIDAIYVSNLRTYLPIDEEDVKSLQVNSYTEFENYIYELFSKLRKRSHFWDNTLHNCLAESTIDKVEGDIRKSIQAYLRAHGLPAEFQKLGSLDNKTSAGNTCASLIASWRSASIVKWVLFNQPMQEPIAETERQLLTLLN